MATLQERIREYLGSQADTPAARNIAQQAEAGYAEALGQALGAPAMGAAGMVGGRGASTPAEREYLNSVLNQTRQGPGANVPRFDEYTEGLRNRGMDTPREREFLRQAMPAAPMTPSPQVEGMGGMTPAERDQYFKSFEDAGINLTPGAGLARGLRGIDQAVTNATTAPGNLGENQLRNIAGGQSNVSPYGLGLGQQMYNPMGLLNF